MAYAASYSTNIRNGILGSLAGGMVFGMMMTMMGMMGMVAMLVHSDGVVVGWLVHLGISAIFGVALGLLLTWVPRVHPILTGLAWSMMAWAGGALVLMPLFLGTPSKVFDFGGATPWYSLMGHMAYGLVAGLVAWALARRTAPAGARGRAAGSGAR